MDLDQLIKELQNIRNEISEAHKLPKYLEIIEETEKDLKFFDVVRIEPVMLPGCGCWQGAKIYVKNSEGEPK